MSTYTPSAQSQHLLKAIKDQTSQLPPNMIYVLDIVSIRFGGYFTPQIRAQLQKYQNLQMLTLNDCGIVSLENFPTLTNLIRLDLVFNQIKDQDIQYLKYSRHLQTLMLGANQIRKIESLEMLKGMKNLMQLDLINNPVFRQPGYRQKVFQLLPSLYILDTMDKSGKDAYNNVTMLQTVHRIPEHLFSHGQDNNIGFHHAIAHHQQKKTLIRAFSRTGSLEAIPNQHDPKNKRNRPKSSHPHKPKKQKQQRQDNYNPIFPRTKIRKLLKQTHPNIKISKNSAVYMSAILQYITVQFLEQIAQQTRSYNKSRITPLIIKRYLEENCEGEMGKLWKSAILGTMGQ